MPETIVYRHNPPRDLAATLAWARGLLILILLVWAFRQYFSVRSGFGGIRFRWEHPDAYPTVEPGDVFTHIYWPIGMTVVCLALLASSAIRFVLDRRAVTAIKGWAGATVGDDGLELRLIGCLATRALRLGWDEVIGAWLFGDLLKAPHVLVQATRRRRYRLPPHMDHPAEFVAQVASRARGVSAR